MKNRSLTEPSLIMSFGSSSKRLEDKGGIAPQVHGGGDFTKQFVRYRNIRVKELNKK